MNGSIIEQIQAWTCPTSWNSFKMRSIKDCPLYLSSFKVQIAALSVYPLQEDLLIVRFCKALARSRPVQEVGIATMDLSIVFKSFLKAPFEPISETSLRLLTLITVRYLQLHPLAESVRSRHFLLEILFFAHLGRQSYFENRPCIHS